MDDAEGGEDGDNHVGEEYDEEKADEDMKEYVDEADHEGEGEDED